jgi:hypothetical protein
MFSPWYIGIIQVRNNNKLGFIGQGFHPCTPPMKLAMQASPKEVSWNFKNFQKHIFFNGF